MSVQDLGKRLPRPTPMSFLALLWLLVISAANRFSLGPISVAGVLTVLTAGVAALSLFNLYSGSYRERPEREPFLPRASNAVPGPLVLFIFWVLLESPRQPTVDGVQNVLVDCCFVATLLLTSRLSSEGTADRLLGRLRLVGWVVALVYLATVAMSGTQADTIYTQRAVALEAVILLGCTVAARNSRWLPLALLAATVLSLSRTATVVAVLIWGLGIAVRGHRRGRLMRALVLLSGALVGVWLLVTRYAPLRDRFLGGDQEFHVNGVALNTSGRGELWAFVWQSAKQHLWFGGGPGSAEQVVTAHFGGVIGHPHNDYLRLLHDFGVVGLGLFVLGYAMLMRRTWVRGRSTGHPIHWAAFLSLGSVAAIAATDNPLVCPFVMIPLGLIVGASLARDGRSGAQLRPRHTAPGVALPEDDLVEAAAVGNLRHRVQ